MKKDKILITAIVFAIVVIASTGIAWLLVGLVAASKFGLIIAGFAGVIYFAEYMGFLPGSAPRMQADITPVATDDTTLEELFGITKTESEVGCNISDLPNPNSVLIPNTIKLDSQAALQKLGEKVVDFYKNRKIELQYAGGQSGANVNLIKFREADGATVKTTDIKKHLVDLTRQLTNTKFPIGVDDITFIDIIPGETSFGFYLPSMQNNIVRLHNLISDPNFLQYIDKNTLKFGKTCLLNTVPFLLGSGGQMGQIIYNNAVEEPHLLIAGATGAGKSVSINSLISTLLLLHTPQSLHLYLGDPKIVEFQEYRGLPHVKGFETKPEKIVEMIGGVLQEMEKRYQVLGEKGKKNIYEYNRSIRKPENFMPYVVLVIDEFADLMTTTNNNTFTEYVQRIAQMARAAGIFIILATQRPSVEVIPGIIKANFTNRIAFRCASEIDSRVILDSPLAATLLGRGDGLIKNSHGITRFQGVYIDDVEINRIIKFWE